MLRKIIKYIRWIVLAPIRLVHLSRDVEKLNFTIGMMMVDHQMRELEGQVEAGSSDLNRFERRVFSRGGDWKGLAADCRPVPVR